MEVALRALELNKIDFVHLSQELQSDKEFVMEAVKQDYTIFNNIYARFKNDEYVILAAATKNANVLELIDYDYCNSNRRLMLRTITHNFSCYCHVPFECRHCLLCRSN
jgi:hypothetical protein